MKKIGDFPPAEPGRHQCQYCGRSWSQEKYLINHPCEYKKRWDQRDERVNKSALMVYNRVLNKKITYEEFIYNKYFNAFVKIIRFAEYKNITSLEKYIDFVRRHQIKLDDWNSEDVYEKYIRDYVENENVDAAMERNIKLMEQWANKNESHWTEFFEKVAPALAVDYIKQGRLSPWIFYLKCSQEKLFTRMSLEQLEFVEKYAPIKKWKAKFAVKKEEVNKVREIFKQAGF